MIERITQEFIRCAILDGTTMEVEVMPLRANNWQINADIFSGGQWCYRAITKAMIDGEYIRYSRPIQL